VLHVQLAAAQMSVHVLPDESLYWSLVEARPLPPSLAPAERLTEPVSGVLTVSDVAGAVLSTSTPARVAVRE
jgi:hypothetical protein